MTECRVLRCHKEASATVTLNEELQFRAGICDDHDLDINAGTSWQAKDEDGETVLYLGLNADPRITGFTLTQTAVHLTEQGPGLVVTFSTSLDNEAQPDATFWMSYDKARRIASILEQFVPDNPEAIST